jgi:hypothetical protein
MPRYEDCPLLFLIAYSAGKPRRIEEALEKNMNSLKVAQNLWLHRAESQTAAADIRDGLTQFLGPADSLTVFRLTSNDFSWFGTIPSNDSIKAIFAGIHQ